MEAEKIRTLLAAEKIEKVAKQLELPLPTARDIRVQAMNLVLGRCVLCGKSTLAGMCGYCKKNASHRRMIPWSPVKLLKQLKPSDQILRRQCESCGHTFMLSAKYLLRRLFSGEELKSSCNSCVEKEQEALRRKEQELEEAKRREFIAALEHARALERDPHLFYQPFAGSEKLKRIRETLAT